ncbi:hypothetical protein C4K16_2210 [Pseudomonas chlororaphis subsp. aurantiaca]|nr:hypothetical protein C4K16_2210 [Pseudomonas chlororaphis subsp. aurantiaca]
MACLALDSRYSLLPRQLPQSQGRHRIRATSEASLHRRWVSVACRPIGKHLARIKGAQRLKTEIPMQKSTELLV